MTHPALYFLWVFGALLAVATGLILVARAAKWKPTPIRPVWAVLVIVVADLVAGLGCSYYGKDIHILYWWLLALPIAAVGIPLIVITTTFCVRLFNVTLFSIVDRYRHKR